MSTNVADLVRIELDTSPYPNQIANHSGQYGRAGSWSGWTAVKAPTLSGESLAGTYGDGWALELEVNGLHNTWPALGPRFPIAAGEYVAIDWTLAPALKTNDPLAVNLSVDWTLSDNTRLEQQVALADVGTKVGAPWTLKTVAGNLRAPAGAVEGQVIATLNRAAAAGGATLALGYSKVYAARLSVTRADVAGNRPFLEPTWTDLTGKANTVKIKRGGDLEGVTDRIEPGLLTAVILDPAADPATNPNMRKGRNVRVRGRASTSSAWSDVVVAQCDELLTEYEKDRTVVTLTATDALTTVAGTRRPLSWSGSLEQQVAGVLGVLDVPLRVTGSGPATTSQPHTYDEELDALEQLVRVRDTFGAVLYVDRSGVLNVSQNVPETASSTFSDSHADAGAIHYSRIRADFGSRACVNALTIARRHPNEPDGTKVYGPFENRKSIADWGRVADEVTILDGDPTAKASALLRAYATPRPNVHEVTWNASKAGLGPALALELYDVARVKFARAGIDKLHRIIGLEHEVTPRGWRVTARFRPLEAPETVDIVNANGPNGGLGDLDIPTPAPFSSRKRGSNLSIASGSWVSVALDSVVAETGIEFDLTNRWWRVPKAGLYLVTFGAYFAFNATGRRIARIDLNGITHAQAEATPYYASTTNANAGLVVTQVVRAPAARAIVQLLAFQSSGGALALTPNTYASITYLGE